VSLLFKKNCFLLISTSLFLMLTHNGWQLPEGGVLEALHCQPTMKFEAGQNA
jgi:hypothetical protein